MSALQRRMLAAAALLSVSLAACSDSTSPNTVDAADLQNSFASATATFQNNAAFQSVQILSLSFPQFAAVGIAIPSLTRLLSRNTKVDHPPRSRAIPASSVTMNPQALFPSNVLGKTLQWDTATAQYVIGPMTGAPATGVRILLYVADEITNQPMPSLSVLGYLDLTDLSTPQSNEVGVLLRLASTTIAQYTITAIRGTNSGSIEALGYMKDGTATSQVGFDLKDSLAPDTTFTYANDFTGSDGAAIHVVVTVPPVGGINILTRLTKGHNSLELNATGEPFDPLSPLSGTVKFNGVSVGSVGGTSIAPTITGVTGHTLTTAQSDALLAIFATALTNVLEISNGIFGPGIVVFNH